LGVKSSNPIRGGTNRCGNQSRRATPLFDRTRVERALASGVAGRVNKERRLPSRGRDNNRLKPMRLRSLVAMAATSVLSLHAPALASWPAHDANQDGVIGFHDLNEALIHGDFARLNHVLSDWGRVVGPDVVGNPTATGADAKAIARWDAVPGQFVDGVFRVGVVAYHMNEIQEVRFFRDGAPLATVTQRTLNPDTGVEEFWITLNGATMAEGEVTLSALVLPRNGVPRILDGAFSAAVVNNGEHSLPLVVRRTPPARVYVGYDGADTNPGTRAAPLATIAKALRVVPDGGEIVLLNAGGYQIPESGVQRNNTRWITVRPDEGLSREMVGITSPNRGLLRANVARVRWQNVTFDFAQVSQIYNLHENMAWIDGCRFIDTRGWIGADGSAPPVRNPWFATNSVAHNMLYGFTQAALVRGCDASQISGDVFQQSKMVLRSTAETVSGSVLEHHTDVFQWWGPQENLIIADVVATDLTVPQCMFMRPSWVQGNDGSQTYWMRNVAFVDLRFDMHPVWNNGVNWGGAPWSQLQGKYDHVIFQNVELANQRIMLRSDVNTGAEAFEAKNLLFRDVGLHPLTYDAYVGPGGAAPLGVSFVGCYPHPDAD